jgi:hypothetical protein
VADRIPVIAGEVARRIGAPLPDLTPEMTMMFIDIIPEFRHDQAVQRLMVASTASNPGAVVDMLLLGISLEDIAVPPAAAEYARGFAQHDLSLEALLRAYRLGEHTFLQWVIEDLRRQALPADDAIGVTSRIGTVGQRPDAARAARVRAVLAAEGPHHVLGRADAGPGPARMAHRGGRLGRRRRCQRAAARGRAPAHRGMRTNADARALRRSTIWALMSFPGRPSLNLDRLGARWPSTAHCASPWASLAPGWPGSGPRTRRRCARQVAEIGAQQPVPQTNRQARRSTT